MKPRSRSKSNLFSAAALFVLCSPLANAGTVSTTFSFQQGDLQRDGSAYGTGTGYAGAVDGRITDNTATSAKSTTSPITLGNQFVSGSPNGQQHCGLFSYDLSELNSFIAANTTATSAVTVTSVSFKLMSAGGVSGTAMALGLYGTDPFTSSATWSEYTTGSAWTQTPPYQNLASPNDTVAYGWTGGPSALTVGLGGTNPNTGVASGSPLTWGSSAYFIDTLANALARPDKTIYLTARGTFFSNSDNRLNVYTSPNATPDNRPELLISLSVSDASDWTGGSGTSWATAGNWTNAPATGSQVRFNSLSTANLSTTLNANFNLNGISLINPTGPVSIGGANTLTLGTGGLDLSAATQNLTITAPMVLGGAQIWNVASGRTLSVSGTVTGSGALTLFGAGKVSLGASNILPNGATSGNLTVIGTLDPNGTSQSVNGLSGAGVIDNTAAGTTTLSIGYNDVTSTFSGTIQNTGGALAVDKQGTGGLTLSGSNSFSGGTTINGGSLSISSDANLGAASGGITFGASTNLNIGADIASSNRVITLSPGVQGAIQLAAGVDYTNSGKVTGSGSLKFKRTGSGTARTVTLASLSNDFTGSLTIDQENTSEQISVTVNSLADPVGAGNIICGALNTNTFPSLRLGSGATGGLTLNNRRIELAGAMNTGSYFIISNDNTTNPVIINSDLLVSGTAGTRRLSLSGVAGPVNEFAGDIADGGSVVNVTKSNTGAVWTLSGNNSHSGGTVLGGGAAGSQLNINSPTALGTGTFSIANGDSGKLDNTSGVPLTLTTNNAQTWANNFNFVGTNALNLGTGAVTMGGNRAISVTANTLTVGGNIGESSAGFGITKSGAGTLVFNGANTYTGTTSVTGGTLQVNGSLDAASAVSVTGGNLGGTGTIGGTVTVGAAGNIAPGASAGTLTISGGLNVAAMAGGAGKLKYELNALAGTNDKIVVGGTLTIGVGALGFGNFDFTNLGGLQAGTYTLISSAGINPGDSLDGADLGGAIGLLTGTLAISGNDIVLNVTGGGNTPPTISDITNQSVPSGGNTGALAFTVGDAETAVGSLNVSGSSSNTTLVPNGNIVFGGSGASRTVTVTPVSGLTGSATITVTVSDGSLTANDTFTLTVTDNYLSWATLNGVTGGVTGDSDNDGVKNLVEYALVNGGERGVLSGNTITFTKRGGVYGTDVTYGIVTSTDLTNWSTPGSGVSENAATISYTFTPSTPVKNFARLKVVQVP